MVATVRAWSFSGPNQTTIALPAGVQDGDFLALFVGKGGAGAPSLPTSGGGAWASQYTGSGGVSSFIESARLSTKVKAAGDGTVTHGGSGSTGAVMVALYDVDVATLFTAVGQTANSNSVACPAGTPANAGFRFSFAALYGNIPGGPPSLGTPAGTTLGATSPSGAYHRVSGYIDTVKVAAGVAFSVRTVTSGTSGGNVGVSFVVYDLPAISGSKMKASGAFGVVKPMKYRSAGVFVAKPLKVKVSGSFVTAD